MSRTLKTTAPATAPATPRPAAAQPLCTHCGADRHDDFRVLSRHHTSVGTTVWVRCSCGALQVRVVTRAGTQLVARGRRHAADGSRTAAA